MARWISELKKDQGRLWNGQRNLVKDFRSCLGFWEILTDGYLIASLTTYAGFNTAAEFRDAFADNSAGASENLFNAIKNLARDLTTFSYVHHLRDKSETGRDTTYENHILFLQHALTMRNFAVAMREGDSGRVCVSLSYLTVWFQATTQFNYAMECLHLTACLNKLWSHDLVKYWMHNCLINPSGKKEGWMACDFLGEYVVREVKNLMPFNINETTSRTLRNVYSPQIMLFREVRKKMQEETDAPTFGEHSSSVAIYGEVETVATRLITGKFCKRQANRPSGDDPERKDLHMVGIEELGKTKRIATYIEKLEYQQGFLDNDWEEDNEEVVNATDTVFLGPDDGEEWL